MNNDGKKDMVTVVVDPSETSAAAKEYRAHQVVISISQGDGIYEDQIAVKYEEQPWEVSAEDIDGDGRNDLVAIVVNDSSRMTDNALRKHKLVVSYQNPDGTFKPKKVLRTYDNRPN
jgi:secreted trypsin-like serine protease|tara:strand:- start:18698 stop:19048 length:351 start_codon:yes stop_codon:yes gene_type:complete